MDTTAPLAAARRRRRVTFGTPGTYDVLLPDPPVHARDGHRPVRRCGPSGPDRCWGRRRLAAAPAASAAVREYWVAAVPVTWNIVPNQRDAIMGMRYDAVADRLPDGRLPALHEALAAPLPNAPPGSATRT